MQQLICPSTGTLEVVDRPAPVIGEGEVLLQLELCGICGTDLMKVYDPSTPKPVRLGHEVIGTVVEKGSGVDHVNIGQRVAVAHHVPDYSSHYTRRGSGPMDDHFKRTNLDPGGFAELIRLSALHVQHTMIPVPDGMPDLRAVFMEPLACCLRTLDRVAVLEGDSALIVGVGAVGLLFVPLLCDHSVTVLVTDVRRERLETAQTWGASAGFQSGVDDVVSGVQQWTDDRGADQVILTVVNRATLELGLSAVRDGGTLVLFGVKPETVFPVDLWQVWRRKINLISSYSATPDLMARAMAILRRPQTRLEETVSHLLPLKEAPHGFGLAHDGQASKVVIGRE